MYEISVEKHFDAAHFLRGYKGKCEALHGHRFRVVARITAAELDEIGLAYDFSEIKQHLDDILKDYDHTCLNDMPGFAVTNPSSENIATAIYTALAERLAGAPVTLSCLEVWESPLTGVSYRPG